MISAISSQYNTAQNKTNFKSAIKYPLILGNNQRSVISRQPIVIDKFTKRSKLFSGIPSVMCDNFLLDRNAKLGKSSVLDKIFEILETAKVPFLYYSEPTLTRNEWDVFKSIGMPKGEKFTNLTDETNEILTQNAIKFKKSMIDKSLNNEIFLRSKPAVVDYSEQNGDEYTNIFYSADPGEGTTLNVKQVLQLLSDANIPVLHWSNPSIEPRVKHSEYESFMRMGIPN